MWLEIYTPQLRPASAGNYSNTHTQVSVVLAQKHIHLWRCTSEDDFYRCNDFYTKIGIFTIPEENVIAPLLLFPSSMDLKEFPVVFIVINLVSYVSPRIERKIYETIVKKY